MAAVSDDDVIIIGSGPGGRTLAYVLAPTGKQILLLERGDYVQCEKENWETRAVHIDGRYQPKEVWRDKTPLHPNERAARGRSFEATAAIVIMKVGQEE